MTIEITTLPNGVRTVVDHYDSPLAAVAVTVECGTRHEAPYVNGVAHFLEHMAFKGTERRTPQMITGDIEDRGGWINAQTSRDTTQFYAGVLREDLDVALDVIADIVLNSTFPEDEVDRERGVILQENRDLEDDATSWLSERLMETAFSGALALPGLGRPETIHGIHRADIHHFVDQHYIPAKIIVAAAGGVDPASFTRAVEGHCGAMKPARTPAPHPTAYRGGVFRHAAETPNVNISIAFPSLPLGHPNLYAEVVFAQLVGGCQSSMFWQELREKRGLCYAADFDGYSWVQAGISVASMSCGEDEAPEAIAMLCEQLKRSRDGFNEAQLSLGRKLCKANIIMGRERAWSRLSSAVHHLAIHGKAYDLDEELAMYDGVGPAHIARTIERMWSARPAIAIRGPRSVCDLDIEGMLR